MEELLTPEIQRFIRDHEQDDVRSFVLKNQSVQNIPAPTIAQQIIGRQKAKEKFPLLYQTENILYPPQINLEQSSSQTTAEFKADFLRSVLPPSENQKGADLTGGWGIDTFFLSRLCSEFEYVEVNAGLLQLAQHNHRVLGAANIQYHHTSAEDFLHALQRTVDFIFVDPSRRAENKKVVTFKESVPDIAALQTTLFQKTRFVLIKASPLLDIKAGLSELTSIRKVIVLAVDNEVKELLFFCDASFQDEPEIEAVNLTNPVQRFGFSFPDENTSDVPYADPLTYLYEPNASLLKAGAFKSVAKYFNLSKLHANTHLYTSDSFIENFPGRTFKPEALVKPDPKEVKAFFPEGKANVVTRNYPLTPEELKKKTGLKDGGEKYLIGFSGQKQKFVVIAQRLK